MMRKLLPIREIRLSPSPGTPGESVPLSPSPGTPGEGVPLSPSPGTPGEGRGGGPRHGQANPPSGPALTLTLSHEYVGEGTRAEPPARRRQRRGATTVEYMLILAFIVLPIGLMLPLFMKMILTYCARMTQPISLPFP